MTNNCTAGRRALFIGLVSVLLAVISGCAGHQPVSGAGDSALLPRSAPAPLSPPNQPQQRDIVTTGSVTVTVAGVGHAVDQLIDLAGEVGGRVDDRTERTSSGQSRNADLILRIPSQKVDEFLNSTKQLGSVTSLSLQHEDVTAGRVDLDARIAALQTSVDRLTALMKSAPSTADLLQAEEALSKRQADLDSLRAQRAQLGDQITYATITVTLSSASAPPTPGFAASVQRGWHALVSFTHGAIRLVGFLLPWMPVLLVVGGTVFLSRRRGRRRNHSPLEPANIGGGRSVGGIGGPTDDIGADH